MRSATSDSPRITRALRERGSALLWFAVVGAPAAWFLSLAGSFFLVPWACHDRAAVIPLVSLAALLVCVAAGLAAWRLWRDTGLRPPGKDGGPLPRTRLMASVGMAISALFTIVVLVQGLAGLLISPCQAVPRGPADPSATAPRPAHQYVFTAGALQGQP